VLSRKSGRQFELRSFDCALRSPNGGGEEKARGAPLRMTAKAETRSKRKSQWAGGVVGDINRGILPLKK
jgi:hypothetical protein